jgi:hypothetical protein
LRRNNLRLKGSSWCKLNNVPLKDVLPSASVRMQLCMCLLPVLPECYRRRKLYGADGADYKICHCVAVP